MTCWNCTGSTSKPLLETSTQVTYTFNTCHIVKLCVRVVHGSIFFFAAKPGFLDFKGKAKWEAWNGRKGLSNDEAKNKYVEIVDKLVEQIGLKA